MKVLIVDDNNISRAAMRQLAAIDKKIILVGECDNAAAVYPYVHNNEVDILLLDIEMPGINGLELARTLGEKGPVIIFTTSKTEYAVEAFELNVADYLVKPVMPARFIQAIERARTLMDSRKEAFTSVNPNQPYIFFRDSNVVRRINMDDILYVEAMGDYVKVHTAHTFYAIHATLKSVEEKLPSTTFMKVHRSYIVAVPRIDSLQDGVITINGKGVPVADAYRAALNKRINVI